MGLAEIIIIICLILILIDGFDPGKPKKDYKYNKDDIKLTNDKDTH